MPRFWPNDGECLIGSIHVQVTNEVDEQLIIKEVTKALNSKIKGLEELTIQVEKIEDTCDYDKSISKLPHHSINVFLRIPIRQVDYF
ncbi:1920_t:CDS:2 [Racocetra fulgida]|uniref:1920_t:CDS:1 n=1 Tax=Racocetra fulgida TaxID=60492 RepID=A0A9N8ZJ51_9GLOM|nr:1920_t:CDS:2 [Racocetra fulgida]